jgi:hypothetical protein
MSNIAKQGIKTALPQWLKDYFNHLWNKRTTFLIFGFVGLVLGYLYAWNAKKSYNARLVFMINESKSASSNPLSAIASQFGLSQISPTVTEDRVFYLSTTNKILGEAILSPYDDQMCIADKMIEDKGLKETFARDTSLAKFDKFTAKTIQNLSYAENKILGSLINGIILSNKLLVESYKKKTSSFVGVTNSGIMLVNFEDFDEKVCKELPLAIYSKLSVFYTEAVTKSLQKNYDLICKREDSLKNVLQELESESALALDEGFNVIKYEGKIREKRLLRDLEIVNLMYAEVLKNKEIAKFNLEQEKPVFQLIDEPMLPLEVKKKSKMLHGFLGLIGFGLLTMFFQTIMFIRKNPELLSF